jgi:hypothetical protein
VASGPGPCQSNQENGQARGVEQETDVIDFFDLLPAGLFEVILWSRRRIVKRDRSNRAEDSIDDTLKLSDAGLGHFKATIDSQCSNTISIPGLFVLLGACSSPGVFELTCVAVQARCDQSARYRPRNGHRQLRQAQQPSPLVGNELLDANI